jgi:hypothetical protein
MVLKNKDGKTCKEVAKAIDGAFSFPISFTAIVDLYIRTYIAFVS